MDEESWLKCWIFSEEENEIVRKKEQMKSKAEKNLSSA
jgi:hypothetical protein